MKHVALMGAMRNTQSWLESLNGRDHSVDLHVNGRLKMDFGEIRFGGVDWIHLAQDRDWWWAVVNTVMNLRISSNVGNFLTS
jgi:hypothetical protein